MEYVCISELRLGGKFEDRLLFSEAPQSLTMQNHRDQHEQVQGDVITKALVVNQSLLSCRKHRCLAI